MQLKLQLVKNFKISYSSIFTPNNNNNKSSLEGLDPNIAALVNALTDMNLTGRYYLKEESFVKLTEFEGIETEDSNEWLERFNWIAEAN